MPASEQRREFNEEKHPDGIVQNKVLVSHKEHKQCNDIMLPGITLFDGCPAPFNRNDGGRRSVIACVLDEQ